MLVTATLSLIFLITGIYLLRQAFQKQTPQKDLLATAPKGELESQEDEFENYEVVNTSSKPKHTPAL